MGTCPCFGSDNPNDAQPSQQSTPQKNKLKISILTWNVGAAQPSDSIVELFMHNNTCGDIVAVGLEEVVDLNLKNLVIDDDTNDILWRKKILQVLNKDKADEFSVLKSVDMVGVLLLIFIRNNIRNDVQNVIADKIGTGLLNIVGNKGGVGVRFDVYNKSIVFICGHLAAHKKEIDERNEDYHEIIKDLTFDGDDDDDKNDNYRNISVLDHDIVFFFGDLNYRLDFNDNELQNVYDLINDKKWNELLIKDQLLNTIKANKAFKGFNEEKINFQPTYKFEPGTNDYEQKKKRMPSYCDRILWKTNDNSNEIDCLKYESCMDHKISDHKPVFGFYEVDP